MARSIQLSPNSWKQPFRDRKKTVDAWVANTLVGESCNVKDQTKRLLELLFEQLGIGDQLKIVAITEAHAKYLAYHRAQIFEAKAKL